MAGILTILLESWREPSLCVRRRARSVPYTAPLHIPSLILIFLAAAIGSAVNSVAGGDTLVTFPVIVWLGVPPLVTNATGTVALWPGAVCGFGGRWSSPACSRSFGC